MQSCELEIHQLLSGGVDSGNRPPFSETRDGERNRDSQQMQNKLVLLSLNIAIKSRSQQRVFATSFRHAKVLMPFYDPASLARADRTAIDRSNLL